jgi:hypothetical protein
MHLEEKRRVRVFIPEEGGLGFGRLFYLRSFGPTAFEQGYRPDGAAYTDSVRRVRWNIIQNEYLTI